MGLTNGGQGGTSSSDAMTSYTYFSYISSSTLSSLLSGTTYFNPQYLHECLMGSVPDYRVAFADRVYELLYNGGVLVEDSVKDYFTDIQGMMGTAMICESARWGDASSSSAYTINTWKTACTTAYNWLTDRVDTVIDNLRGLRITRSGSTSTVSNLSSTYFYPSFNPASFNTDLTYTTDASNYTAPTSAAGTTMQTYLLSDASSVLIDSSTITSGTTIYYTLDGSDPRESGGDVNSGALTYTAGSSEAAIIEAAAAVETEGALVNIRAYKASTGEWSALNYATVYAVDPTTVETVIPNVVINEVLTNPETLYTADYIELYNNESQSVDVSGWILIDSDISNLSSSDAKTYWISDNTSIAAGGTLLFDENDFSFGIKAKGEAVYLLMPDANGEYTDVNGAKYSLVDTVTVPASDADQAYGRVPDGTGDFAFLDSPSPGALNVQDDDDDEDTDEEEADATLVQTLLLDNSSGTWTATVNSESGETLNEWDSYELTFVISVSSGASKSATVSSFTFELSYYSNVFTANVDNQTTDADSPYIIVSESETGQSPLTISVKMGTNGYTLQPGESITLGSILFVPTDDQANGLLVNESLDNLGTLGSASLTVTDLSSASSVALSAAPIETAVRDVPFDLNDDGAVSMADFILFAQSFNAKTDETSLNAIDNTNLRTYAEACDFDDSGVVDMTDFIYFSQNFNRKVGDSITYPVAATAATASPIYLAVSPGFAMK